jgi:hypothetical protein
LDRPAQSLSTVNYSSGDAFLFIAVGVGAPWASWQSGEAILVGGASAEGGPYIGLILAAGVSTGTKGVSHYVGTEYLLNFSPLSVEATPIMLTEINAGFVGAGRYQVNGAHRQTGGYGFLHVGPNDHTGISFGMGMNKPALDTLIRMVAPVGAFRNPTFGCCDEEPY